jgi:hypothetical protein
MRRFKMKKIIKKKSKNSLVKLELMQILTDIVDVIISIKNIKRDKQYEIIAAIVKLYISKLSINKIGEIDIVNRISSYLDSKGAGNIESKS